MSKVSWQHSYPTDCGFGEPMGITSGVMNTKIMWENWTVESVDNGTFIACLQSEEELELLVTIIRHADGRFEYFPGCEISYAQAEEILLLGLHLSEVLNSHRATT